MSPPAEPRADRVTVNRTMLREQIKDVLLQRILDGDYGPGERIVETRVADEFGVSQAPVREALRELEILRLVVSEPFRGARVKETPPRRCWRPTRCEPRSRRSAPGPRRPAWPGASNRSRRGRGDARRRRRGDLRRFATHDVGFHRLIVEASANRTLMELWEALHVDLRTKYTLVQRLEDLAEVAESHVPVMEALDAGDGELAGRRVREHIEGFGRWFAERAEADRSSQPE